MLENKSESWWIIYAFFDWIKSKKATINPINKKDNKCFNNNWYETNSPLVKDDWKKLEKYNLATAFNVLYTKK